MFRALIRLIRHRLALASVGGPPARPAAYRMSLLFTGGIFLIDLWLPALVVLGILYVLPVLISVWGSKRRWTFGIATLCTVLTPIGALTSLTGPDFRETIGGLTTGLEQLLGDDPARQVIVWEGLQIFCALFTIWVTAGLGLMRIEIERELLDTREVMSIALKSSADGILTTDILDRVTFINAAAEQITGWDLEAARGRMLHEVFPLEPDPETRAGPGYQEGEELIPRGDRSVARRRVLRARDGSPHPIETSEAQIFEGDRSVRGRVISFRDAQDLAEYETRLRELAYRDRLTGLPNRTSLAERMQLEIAHARREDRRLGLLFLDLNRFKAINDTLGHHAGDELLRSVAQRLIGCLREADTVARLGGDEFVVLVPGIETASDVRAVADKIIAACTRPFLLEGELHPIGTSIGIALFPTDAADPEALLRCGDRAMYLAKARGGSGFEFFARPSASRAPLELQPAGDSVLYPGGAPAPERPDQHTEQQPAQSGEFRRNTARLDQLP